VATVVGTIGTLLEPIGPTTDGMVTGVVAGIEVGIVVAIELPPAAAGVDDTTATVVAPIVLGRLFRVVVGRRLALEDRFFVDFVVFVDLVVFVLFVAASDGVTGLARVNNIVRPTATVMTERWENTRSRIKTP
jgi:hypothetical protein